MKSRIYFSLAKVLIKLASFCRVCGIHLDYYKQVCVKNAIYSSRLSSADKDEMWAKYR
jgi:hypothetical protein